MMHLKDDAILQKKKLLFEHDEDIYRQEKLKKAVVSYPPRWITIGVTSACSNRCVFCSYHSPDAHHISKVYNLPYMLSLTDFKLMVDMAWEGNVPRVHICGTGEPFFNPHILEMIDYAASVYGTTSVQSNFHPKLFEKGNFLEEILHRKEKLRSITTDFLSGIPEEHERLKKGSSYHDLLAKLRYINQNSDIFLDLHFLLTHLNYHSLIPLIEDFKKYELKNCYLNVVNLFSYDINEFTSQNVVYTSKNQEITEVLHQAVLLGQDSFNPQCRQGMLDVDYQAFPNVHFVEIDFIPGVYHYEAFDTAEARSMWGGLALLHVKPQEREKPLIVRESQKGLFESTYQSSRRHESI